MLSVTVSPKYQVVIPKQVRQSMDLAPGQQMQVVQYENRIELIPQQDVAQLKGFLAGIDTNFEREADRV